MCFLSRLPPKRATSVAPRVLAISPRGYETALWRCGQVECEDVICAVDDVELAVLQQRTHGCGAIAQRAAHYARRLAGVELSLVPRLEPLYIERDYDLLFVYAHSLDDLSLLDAVARARERCAKAVCVIEELWLEELRVWGGRQLERLADFDLVAVQFHGSVDAVRERIKTRCEWLPPGADALRFFPGVPAPPRTIDVFSMGRRAEPSHRALLEYATARGWTYLFDTIDPQRVREGMHEQHRAQTAELVKRSRYFIANRARIGDVVHTAQQQELGFRSFEGAAGGAVLLGHAAQSASARELFDWPDAHVHVPFGSTDLPRIIEELDAQPERVARIRCDNVVHSLRRHDWAHRWRQLLEWVGLPPTARLEQRLRRLHELADEVATPHREPVSSPRKTIALARDPLGP